MHNFSKIPYCFEIITDTCICRKNTEITHALYPDITNGNILQTTVQYQLRDIDIHTVKIQNISVISRIPPVALR